MSTTKHLIYLITNTINNKRYIGQTKVWRLDKRLKEHIHDIPYTKKTCIFHAALAKYGLDAFDIVVLETNIPTELIDEREEYYIKYYNTYYKNHHGYNMTYGGQGTHGYIFTEADRLKQSIRSKAYWKNIKESNPEEYARLCKLRSDCNKGKPKSAETKRKLSAARKGKAPWNKGKKGLYSSKFKNTSKNAQVCAFDYETGKLRFVFNSHMHAARELFQNEDETYIKVRATRIYAVCQSGHGHAYDYIWRYITNYTGVVQLADTELKEEHKQAKAKEIQQFDLAGNYIATYESAAAYSKLVETEYKNQRKLAQKINGCCKGHSTSTVGYIWKYTIK